MPQQAKQIQSQPSGTPEQLRLGLRFYCSLLGCSTTPGRQPEAFRLLLGSAQFT